MAEPKIKCTWQNAFNGWQIEVEGYGFYYHVTINLCYRIYRSKAHRGRDRVRVCHGFSDRKWVQIVAKDIVEQVNYNF